MEQVPGWAWAVAGVLVMLLLSALAWFVAREIQSKDKIETKLVDMEKRWQDAIDRQSAHFANSIDMLSRSVGELSKTIGEFKVWTLEKYAEKDDLEQIERVCRDRYESHQREMKRCQDTCPMRIVNG
jgi:uncharacterized membrane-anchored protein YhcB (DUF1043 family)